MTARTSVADDETTAIRKAVARDDGEAFLAIAERYRPQLRLHCYRMLGSVEDAEDLVQETLLRAWRARSGFEGRSSLKTWLYRIATNACLNELAQRPRRLVPPEIGRAAPNPRVALVESPELPWLEPYPDRLLEPVASSELEPDVALISREMIELTYMVAIQHLPPRQRAILILRDSLGWSAAQTAALLGTSVVAVKSSLQRARAAMRRLLPERLEGAVVERPNDEERAVLKRYMAAYELKDAAALTALLREDARHTMPPVPTWFEGREVIGAVKAWWFGPASEGEFRALPTAANRQPAAAIYLRRHGEADYRLTAVEVLRIEHGLIAEINAFLPALTKAFDLPAALS